VSDYIDHRVGGHWFISGEHADGCVDVSDGTNDIFEHVTREQAARYIAIRDEFLAKVRAEYEANTRGAV
jgi:hypothetical protein